MLVVPPHRSEMLYTATPTATVPYPCCSMDDPESSINGTLAHTFPPKAYQGLFQALINGSDLPGKVI